MLFRIGFIRLGLVLAFWCALALGIASSPAAAASPGGVAVQGTHLVRDGAVWLPRGVQIVGLVAPEGSLTGRYVAAQQHFGVAELQAAQAAHADLIRFQVSQYGLDPEDPLYSRTYVQQVRSAVEDARSLGLTVIVSLQAEAPAGRTRVCPEPDAGAERAWQQLVPMFAGDPGVMFELFNEPSLLASPTNWQLWQYGGPVALPDGSTCEAVGMQTLIDDIRTDGASNVIIVPGLAGEGTLAGMPTLTDPASPSSPQLAYGIHYPSLSGGSTVWDRKFGNAAASVPVLVTEWYANSFHLCSSSEPQRAAWLLAYLASKQIGMVGYAFDVPGTIVSGWSYAPTTYANFACEPPTAFGAAPSDGPHTGPGQLLFNEFAGLAQAEGTSLDSPQGWVIDLHALRRLAVLAPGLVRHFFNTPRTFVTGASSTSLQRLGLPAAIPTASFTAEGALAQAVNQRTLPLGTRAVVFDDEHWSRTPRAQQLDPAYYYQRAGRVAHRHGLLLVAAPAPNLILARRPKASISSQYAGFLSRRIAAGAARVADVYDIQAQDLEAQRSPYASFVQSVAFQASQVHPNVELLAGLSTDPPGRQRPLGVLLGAVGGSGPAVSGYALSDPTTNAGCATCAGPYDGVAVALLRGLQNEGF
jgi:Cellulase (glycosyl hydrolase family 5)